MYENFCVKVGQRIMFYIVFALVILGIGIVDVDPLIAWIEDRGWPPIALTIAMMTTLGLIPATIVGAGIFGDTVIRGDRKR